MWYTQCMDEQTALGQVRPAFEATAGVPVQDWRAEPRRQESYNTEVVHVHNMRIDGETLEREFG
jgi:hypothetical protein